MNTQTNQQPTLAQLMAIQAAKSARVIFVTSKGVAVVGNAGCLNKTH